MGWQQFDYASASDIRGEIDSRFAASAVNDQCFIRRQHHCGKMFGASKSCFIACPTNDELEPILGLMSEKLSRLGIEPIIAVKERAYGQDIFCTKICGKIIEARFCIVILDDTIRHGSNVPNPNVYYEYGLMTALRKQIIPLQKDELDLAFNIQSYDTIKYNSRNVAAELDRGIRDAIRLSQPKEGNIAPEAVADKVILRRMEIAGFELKDEQWFLSETINDTAFRSFYHHDKKFYAYLCKVDSTDDMRTYLDDMSVVIHRTENKSKALIADIALLKATARRAKPRKAASSMDALDEELLKAASELGLIANIFIAFVIGQHLDSIEFLKSAAGMILGHKRYHLTQSQEGKLPFGDIVVDFATSQR